MTKLDMWYGRMLSSILNKGTREMSKRTGHFTTAFAGVTFRTDLEKDGFPLLTLRPINVKAFIAEQMWFQQGTRNPTWLQRHTKIWDSFVEPDGQISTAYGFRWKEHFYTDQIENMIEKLTYDPSSRHAVVITWDVMDVQGRAKNVPCPFAFTCNIIGGRLNMHNMVRSNDMVLGFPYDVAGFAFLQLMLAQRLGVRPGIYTHSISHAHIYDIHFPAAAEIVARYRAYQGKSENEIIGFDLPDNSLTRASEGDDSLLDEATLDIDSRYMPLPKIPGLKIVL